jgi:hypothetical protein
MRRPPQRFPRDDDRSRGPGAGAVNERKGAGEVDSRVEELTRELAEAINDAEAEGRVVMRDYAIDLLRESVESDVSQPQERVRTAKGPPLNPFALGIPVLLIGVVLAVIFTPVGVVLLLLGIVLCATGVVMALARSARDRWRSRDDVQ